jgi:hypothetical protein
MATFVAPIDESPAMAVARAAAGDESAFARIIQAHRDDMTRVCFVICGDLDIADEAVQAAWPIVWRRGTYLEFNQKGGPDQACALVTNSRHDRYTTAYPTWDEEGYHEVWIVDVDGVRLVIDAFSPSASSASVRAELQQVVESIQFER